MERNQKNNSRLTEKQEKVLPVLLANPCIAEAARQSGVCTSKTLHEWFREAAFKAEVDRLRNEVFNEAMELLKSGSKKATETLIKLLDSDQEKTRLAAAKELLGFSFRSKETLEIEERINSLEQAVANEKP